MVVYTVITSGEDSIPVDGEIIDYLKQYIVHLSSLLDDIEDNPETLEIFFGEPCTIPILQIIFDFVVRLHQTDNKDIISNEFIHSLLGDGEFKKIYDVLVVSNFLDCQVITDLLTKFIAGEIKSCRNKDEVLAKFGNISAKV